MNQISRATLAINGGSPLRSGGWPAWPALSEAGERGLIETARSGRWACSGFAGSRMPLDRVFAERFAAYLGVSHCLATDHGSSGLVMALEGLGIGFDDEVIVPGLTWVACASAVMRVNARPVIVDIDPDTLCLLPDAVERAITPRTAAILVVHLYSCMADVERLAAIASRHGLYIIEDAAQAHGATWSGRKAGSFGDVGVFSMQQGKVMTCGEGGAVVTSDSRLHAVLEQLRNDGRRYAQDAVPAGHMELIETAGVLGANRAPSEFQAAILLDGLDQLEAQCALRARNAEALDRALRTLPGYVPLQPHPQNDRRSYYHWPIRLDPNAFGGRDADVVAQALSAELGIWIHTPYPPLDRHPLLHAIRSKRYAAPGLGEIDVPEPLSNCVTANRTVLLLHHAMLLAEEERLLDVCRALEKIQAHAQDLPRAG